MEELKLHALGQNDHLESLKRRYSALRNKIKGNNTITESEKKSGLDSLKKSFEQERKNSNSNLY